MAVTAKDVKELRERTGAGMLDCKKALEEMGTIDKAIDYLREKGIAKAAKKAGRIAAEGLVADFISEDYSTGAIAEVNSETDFVAKNNDFKTYANNVAKQASTTNAKDIDEFLDEAWSLDSTKTVKDELNTQIAFIGENLNIRRFAKFTCDNGVVASYIHGGGKIGVLVKFESNDKGEKVVELARNIAMQIAAINPKYLSSAEVPSEFIESEREILKQQALNEGKPENIVDKMVEGRLKKELKEYCLLDQTYVKDSDLSVSEYIKSIEKEVQTPIIMKEFVRFETGEGIEKKSENFAEEVAKQMQ